MAILDQPDQDVATNDAPICSEQQQQNHDMMWRLVTLSQDQKQEVQALLQEFAGIFTDVPGRTSITEHDVRVLSGTVPICQRP